MYSSKSSYVSWKATTSLRRKCHLFLSRNLFNLILILLFHRTFNMPILLFVYLILYVPSTICQLCGNGSSWVEPVLSLDQCVLLKDTTQWRWWSSNPWSLRLESSSLPLSHCAPPFCCYNAKDRPCQMPDTAYIVYKVSKPAPGPEVITSFGAQLNWAWNLCCS